MDVGKSIYEMEDQMVSKVTSFESGTQKPGTTDGEPRKMIMQRAGSSQAGRSSNKSGHSRPPTAPFKKNFA